MPKQSAAKITITLPQRLLDVADRLAEERSTTRSGVITELLEKEERARVEEGYREMAVENRRMAKENFPHAVKMIMRHTKWDEPANG